MPTYCAACRRTNRERKFRLPHPNRPDPHDYLFNKWMAFIDNPIYEHKSKEYLHSNIFVCILHFKADDFTGIDNRLGYAAYPTIYPDDIENRPSTSQLNVPMEMNIYHIADLQNDPSTADHTYVQNPVDVGFKQDLHGKVTSKIQGTVRDKRNFRRKIKSMEKRSLKLKEKFKLANNLKTNYKFQRILNTMPQNAATFIRCQLRTAGKKCKSRRFTQEEKLLSLSLYKQGPKAYRYYRQIFSLPSPSTISKLLRQIPLKVGINEQMVRYLRNVSMGLNNVDKCVTVIFDEIFLMPGLKYDAHNRKIYGFEDFGGQASKRIADHALVFMVRGLQKNWKLPFAFYFCESGMKSTELVRIIKDVVSAIQSCNLNVMALVCDQGGNNIAALNYLKREAKAECMKQNATYDDSILINKSKLYNIFDVPHLMKGVRNNLLKYDLVFKLDEQEYRASWKHIEQAYEEDRMKEIRAMPKLTEFHVNKEKIKKMKVKYCTQVFSHRVASQMQVLVDHASEEVIDKNAISTVKLLIFFDELFDSLNASQYYEPGKPTRCAMKHNTEHVHIWEKGIRTIKSMYFIKDTKKIIPPTLKNWIQTLENNIKLWNILREKGYKYFLTRRLNQDPVENFFAAIRSHGRMNTKPTTNQFIAAFKTLLINNISSKHSVNANCEDDNSFTITASLNILLNLESIDRSTTAPSTSTFLAKTVIVPAEVSMLYNFKLAYFSGYLLKKMYNIFNNCDICKDILVATSPNVFHSLIQKREYNKMRHLIYPTTSFMNVIDDMKAVIVKELPSNCLKLEILFMKLRSIEYNFSECHEHYDLLKNLLVEKVGNIFIYKWCRDINLILNGKMNIFDTQDEIKISAYEKYKKLYKRQNTRIS